MVVLVFVLHLRSRPLALWMCIQLLARQPDIAQYGKTFLSDKASKYSTSWALDPGEAA